jgi:cyanophycin synthetase
MVSSAEDAWEAAEDIGLPVVVKPTDGNHGRGVFAGPDTREEVEAAYARGRSPKAASVLVERFIPATSTACWWSAASWSPPTAATASVTGDGVDVVELIDSQINTDPRRGEDETSRSTGATSASTTAVRARTQRARA